MKLIMSVFFLVLLLIPSFPAVLPAQSTEPKETPWERFSLSLGGFVTTLDSTVVLGVQDRGQILPGGESDLDAHGSPDRFRASVSQIKFVADGATR